ncbi:hypothetical protein SKAU_G00022150 [Synaphobranchus kaupii]|uniref:Uncharacterized protein n=1 Tax=Synaphobranchus kaupii TaxID=118154 RepID=A0A9Q1GDW9_SYNKA|nr:hypothetical protein SKAU_G00022150 [Synaphobranchus kaupii]
MGKVGRCAYRLTEREVPDLGNTKKHEERGDCETVEGFGKRLRTCKPSISLIYHIVRHAHTFLSVTVGKRRQKNLRNIHLNDSPLKGGPLMINVRHAVPFCGNKSSALTGGLLGVSQRALFDAALVPASVLPTAEASCHGCLLPRRQGPHVALSFLVPRPHCLSLAGAKRGGAHSGKQSGKDSSVPTFDSGAQEEK